MTASIQRVRVRVEGVVQGVGFRPYVHRLAAELGLAGFVRNDSRGAVIEVEGRPDAIEALVARLPAEAPPAAVIEGVEREVVPTRGDRRFGIVESARAGAPDARVSPDIAICEACLRELFDPADRRYRYPFINCTDCGPRFTIVRAIPYDRPNTTMAGFTMCAACAAEDADPANRRFHAQPNACPACGPQLQLVRGPGPLSRADAVRGPGPLTYVVSLLREGGTVAVKGIGGYHRVPGRRRSGGGAAAVAQAPRGEAVRADGGRRRGSARAGRAGAGGDGAPRGARPADSCSPAAATTRAWRRRSRRARPSSA
jgi:hydrogenase maturation protein HypF